MLAGKIIGKIYVLGDNIDTDQIIPARHLVYDLEDPEKQKMYGKYCLSGVLDDQAGLPDGRIPFVLPGKTTSEFQIIVAGKNFGCGSSREHAPASLKIAGVQAIAAESYARIFYRNAIDGGFVIPFEVAKSIYRTFKTGETVEIDPQSNLLRNVSTGMTVSLLPLGDAAAILNAGGIFNYARTSHEFL
ncbi:2,3-dimethylmalate dehydratase small subunit [bacterium BMS3Bbin03]|nr:2,3-dimethylmalate dehydratase small subunit [bacterium BMS3Bbin03]